MNRTNTKTMNSNNDTTTTQNTSEELLKRMTAALNTPKTHQWSIFITLPKSISKLQQDENVSFDVPCTYYNAQTNTLLATFHTLFGSRTMIDDKNVKDQYFAIYLAECSNYTPGIVPTGKDWKVLTKLSDMGSMGYFIPHKDGSIYFAYEAGLINGSTVAIRKYPTMKDFMSNSSWEREVRLERIIHGDQVTCAGTPTITSIVDDDGTGDIHIDLRFHYYYNGLDGMDYPGEGKLVFPREQGNGVVFNSYPWEAKAAKDVEISLRKEGAVGKIGGRAPFVVNLPPSNKLKQKGHPPQDQKFILFEAQMASAGESKTGWLSWRPVLYDIQTKNASVLTFNLPYHLKTFANPQISNVGDDHLLISFFIPSEPFSNTEEVENYCLFDPDKCPTCARDVMVNATSPASPGTVMMLIPSSFKNVDFCDDCSDTTVG